MNWDVVAGINHVAFAKARAVYESSAYLRYSPQVTPGPNRYLATLHLLLSHLPGTGKGAPEKKVQSSWLRLIMVDPFPSFSILFHPFPLSDRHGTIPHYTMKGFLLNLCSREIPSDPAAFQVERDLPVEICLLRTKNSWDHCMASLNF